MKNKLDPTISTPLYIQLAEQFRELIQSDQLQFGDRFPAEMDLAGEYEVSRITVRKAIEDLVNEGILARKQGKGTFVSKPKIDRELVNVTSFTDRMQARGMTAGARSMDVKVTPASLKMALLLGVPENSEIAEIQRLRLINDEPVSLETSYLSLERCPGIQHEILVDQSLYQILDKKYGLRPAYSSKTLELVYASPSESRLLNTVKGASMFLMTALVYSEQRQVMEYVKIISRGDRFRFQM
ncbi:GntR family transcriptional regulator [Paenibacillus radicis (ex Xue et al. 2023)]|uniref:GntR family transcriptional regulator n=1 Tax=Paenibacillus radicis (ex Xue et al. 2023) TaxID=2972489 RepID=A0ABT1YHX8_9BACL|nr:GntR family transcriptional regulator [Paenibacillus radicis (ex Xue et al. 2023)]MCR8632800.1 GntR family transcriptional regulator [Paenibacillus radicis (ex Xue et al. 2023)]